MSDDRRWQTEIDRLKHLLALYDLCECGWERHHHAGCDTQGRAPGATAGCPDFRLVRPADPLETIVEPERSSSAPDRRVPMFDRIRFVVSTVALLLWRALVNVVTFGRRG